jgi:hypothetical protein
MSPDPLSVAAAEEQAFILLVTTLVASIEACALLQPPFTPRATVRFCSR